MEENTKYMGTLSSSLRPGTMSSFGPTRVPGERREERGGELDSKILDAYGLYVLNENGKILLAFADNIFAV